MLNPDQIKLRRRDNEMRQLQIENQRLKNKLDGIKLGIIDLLKVMAAHANFSTGVHLRKMASDLESDA